MDKDQEQKQDKESGFANAWKKAADMGKKATDGVKNFAQQTQKNIHDQQAKKYVPITLKEFKSKAFQRPAVIKLEEDTANRDFIGDEAIGWIQKHKEVQILHLYWSFVKKVDVSFVPIPQIENVYCKDHFDSQKYINTNQIFSKATEEKLAELNRIAYSLGAKSCSIEIIEVDTDQKSKSLGVKCEKNSASLKSKSSSSQESSGKTVSNFEGHNNPVQPELKWFEHDDNIKGLIQMRRDFAIKSSRLELKSSSSATMSKNVACAIDEIQKIKGSSISMENQVEKEYSKNLLFEIEF